MRAVLFDLDGTLLDSSTDLAMSANAVREAMDLPPLAITEVAAMVGDGLGILLQRLLPAGSDFSQARSIFAQHYDQQCIQYTDFFPGFAALLKQCHEQHYRLGVVSNKPQRWCHAIVDHLSRKHQLPDDLWQVVIGGDGVRKPAPDPLFQAFERLQVSPAQATMVGDHANDILAGQAAGCRSIYVTWGYATLPVEVRADVVCEDMAELTKALLHP